jgi:hypothetical protein
MILMSFQKQIRNIIKIKNAIYIIVDRLVKNNNGIIVYQLMKKLSRNGI